MKRPRPKRLCANAQGRPPRDRGRTTVPKTVFDSRKSPCLLTAFVTATISIVGVRAARPRRRPSGDGASTRGANAERIVRRGSVVGGKANESRKSTAARTRDAVGWPSVRTVQTQTPWLREERNGDSLIIVATRDRDKW